MDIKVEIPDKALDVLVQRLFPVQCKGPSDDDDVTAFVDIIRLSAKGGTHQHVSCPRLHEYVGRDQFGRMMLCSSEPFTPISGTKEGDEEHYAQRDRAKPCKYYSCGYSLSDCRVVFDVKQGK